MFGQHLATCFGCGKIWIVGDCIECFCSDECKNRHQELLKQLYGTDKQQELKKEKANV